MLSFTERPGRYLLIAAMNKGLHVLMHKPIANRLYEGRLVMRTAGPERLPYRARFAR